MLKTLEVGANVKGADAINNTIRQHFVELTHRFLQPLNRYFDCLVVGLPTQMSLDRLRPYPEIKPFKQDDFLKFIEQNGLAITFKLTILAPSLPLSSKRSISEFYKGFLKSPNFASWLASKTKMAYRDWRYYYLQLLANADLEYWIELHISNIVECVDLLMRLQEEVARYSSFFLVDGNQVKLAYASAQPTPHPNLFANEEKHQINTPNDSHVASGTLKSNSSLYQVDDEPTGDCDLACLSTSNLKRHLKFKTTPASAIILRPSSSSDEESPTQPFQQDQVNLSTLIPKTSSKTLTGMGDFIPKPEQYKRLLQQLNLVLSHLPPEITIGMQK